MRRKHDTKKDFSIRLIIEQKCLEVKILNREANKYLKI